MSVADRLNKLTTDITNAYTSIENKGGIIPANKNTNNLPTAIDSIQSSNIIGATAEGESLSLTNTKAMPYSDYVVEGKSEQEGEPSPTNPSEIHSVADDVNLLENMTIYNSNHYISPLLKLNPGTYTFNYIGDSAPGIYIRKNDGSNPTNGTVVDQKYTANNITFSISETGNYYIHLYSSTIWEQLTMNNPKLQKGTVATPYSPYNQGTVTIKQRGTTESNDYTLQTEPLRSLPNGVKDTIEEDGIHRRVGRVVLDGTENWTNKNITDNNILFSTNKIDNLFNTTNLTNLTSNYFNVNSSLWTNDNEGVCLFNMNASLRFRINKNLLNNISTVENAINSMKTWLSTHNTEVLYELAEEIIEPLTQNQATTMLDIIKTGSYEGTTNIYTDEDVKPTIGVEYYKKG